MSQELSSRLHDLEWRQNDDIASEIWGAVGDLAGFEVFGSQILIGVYCRPPVLKNGFRIGGQMALEDVWQGKVGLVLKIGPTAFRATTRRTETQTSFPLGPDTEAFNEEVEIVEEGDEKRFNGRIPEVGDWVFSRVQDCEQLNYKGAGAKKRQIRRPDGDMEDARNWDGWPCRLLFGKDIYGRVALPSIIV
jgi:hypothetical protein